MRFVWVRDWDGMFGCGTVESRRRDVRRNFSDGRERNFGATAQQETQTASGLPKGALRNEVWIW